jgi:hypothetical protein
MCRTGQASTEEAAFSAILQYIKAPLGCRQAQITGTFLGSPAHHNAALMTLCQGGCDVCDLRLAALRDMSDAAKQVLVELKASSQPRAALIGKLVVRLSEDTDRIDSSN